MHRIIQIFFLSTVLIVLSASVLVDNSTSEIINTRAQKESDAIEMAPQKIPIVNSKRRSKEIDTTHTNENIENSIATSDSLLSSNDKNNQSTTHKTNKVSRDTIKSSAKFKTVEWTELIPKDDLDALTNPPSYVTDIEDGSLEDQLTSQLQQAQNTNNDDRYQQALTSMKIIPGMDNNAIRISGFVVPIEFDDRQVITQFFLVPFFGACIHVPPPPPNQMIFVDYPQGFQLDNLYDPFWISGILKTSPIENEMATAAYSMQMQSYEIYRE